MIGASAQNASGTTTNTQTTTPERGGLPLTGTLRLRGEADEQSSEPPEQERHIKWAEDVVDNEGQGRKSSKGKLSFRSPTRSARLPSPLIVCCIYHKPRPAGESSSESESSDSDLDDDSDDDAGGGRSDKAHSYKVCPFLMPKNQHSIIEPDRANVHIITRDPDAQTTRNGNQDQTLTNGSQKIRNRCQASNGNVELISYLLTASNSGFNKKTMHAVRSSQSHIGSNKEIGIR